MTEQREPINPQEPEDTFLRSSLEDFLPDVPYILPKDGQEDTRIDLQHKLLRQALGANYITPLAPANSAAPPTALLDSGCGTGRWVLEMARAFPTAHVTGIDLVPPTLASYEREQNATFLQGNILEGLPFPDASFDFVHQRLLVGAIPAVRWPEVVAELVRVTRPGGWVELGEPDVSFGNAGPANAQLTRWLVAISEPRGIDALLAPRISEFLQTAGLKHIDTRLLTLPLGSWGDELGYLAAADIFAVLKAIKPLVLAHTATTARDYEQVCAAIVLEWERRRCTWPFYLACGQRPG